MQIGRILLAVAAVAFAAAHVDAADGLRQLEGKHLTLHTDVPSSPEVDELPQVFDKAVERWCEFFQLDAVRVKSWRAVGCLMNNSERFTAAGLLPASVVRFKNGYSLGNSIWLYNQTSDYYRRHLLFHEGVHCIMGAHVGGSGPPWYSEGLAELLATHLWSEGKFSAPYFPRRRDDVLGLGRIEIVQRGFAERRAKSLSSVLAYDTRAHLENEPYGWCWAAAALLDGHPKYRDRFRPLYKNVGAIDFNRQLQAAMADDWPALAEEWQVLVANLDYGYDFARMAVEFTPGQPLAAAGQIATISADRGWQSSGVKLSVGTTYELVAKGRFQVADKPKPWISEGAGVTVRYYRGHPLGMLMAAVRSDEAAPREPSGLVRPVAIGAAGTIKPQHDGTLYLRINDAPGELSDNAGKLEVFVRPAALQNE